MDVMLPHAKNLPAGTMQSRVGGSISFSGALQFGYPVALIRRGRMAMLRARVPEATIHEDGQPMASEYDVGSQSAVPDIQAEVLPESIACSVQGAAQHQLRSRFAAPDGLHVAAATRGDGRRVGDHCLRQSARRVDGRFAGACGGQVSPAGGPRCVGWIGRSHYARMLERLFEPEQVRTPRA